MGTKRVKSNGKVELRIVHKLLPKPYYTTHDSLQLAERYDEHVTRLLDQGVVPVELSTIGNPTKEEKSKTTSVSALLQAYTNDSTIAVAKSDLPVVRQLQSEVGHLRVAEVTTLWVSNWITAQKRSLKLAPSSIRKKVESLARAFDWWYSKEYGDDRPRNPLRDLRRGYSSYSAEDAKHAGVMKIDQERNRRLHPGEVESIEAAILGEKRPDRERPLRLEHAQSMLLLFRLIRVTGLRLREAYTLRWRNIDFKSRFIEVAPGKTGVGRSVPMTRQVHEWLTEYGPADPSQLVFPFWNEVEPLNRVTARLSQQFNVIFGYAKCVDLKEHDLRHEATCQWMSLRDASGNWLYRESEVMKITGHRTDRTFRRYLSLRATDLSDRLWQ